MNLRQLEYFIAIAEGGSFRAAAGRMRVAPPSLSQQIRVLEAELGGPLLERLARGSRLTPGATGKDQSSTNVPGGNAGHGSCSSASSSARACGDHSARV